MTGAKFDKQTWRAIVLGENGNAEITIGTPSVPEVHPEQFTIAVMYKPNQWHSYNGERLSGGMGIGMSLNDVVNFHARLGDFLEEYTRGAQGFLPDGDA